MARLSVVEEGAVGAPADQVYGLIADMRTHHQHFLPPSFGEIRVEEGGYGAGTIYRVNVTFAGQVRELHMRMDEPQPGRVMTESELHSPLSTTWTITPAGSGCRVRIATVWTSAGGFQGLIERLFAPGVMRKVYRDELGRLDRYAREQAGRIVGHPRAVGGGDAGQDVSAFGADRFMYNHLYRHLAMLAPTIDAPGSQRWNTFARSTALAEKRRTYAHTARPGERVHLDRFDPAETGGLSKVEGLELLQKLDRELTELQELLYAAGQHSVLLLLQGLDTSGKDGTIKRVLKEVNPAGCHIVSFKVPTVTDLAHDFLWRIHAGVPARGQLGVFNRSHYEDVLVVRVHNIVPEKVWRARYEQINAFERLLTDTGTILIKCYLHISKAEQEERLLAREQDVTKAWKLSAADWIERRSWEEYTTAYEDALSECSTKWAPWQIIPADKKWYRNIAVAQLLVEAMRPYKKIWLARLDEIGHRELAAVQEARNVRSEGKGKGGA